MSIHGGVFANIKNVFYNIIDGGHCSQSKKGNKFKITKKTETKTINCLKRTSFLFCLVCVKINECQ